MFLISKQLERRLNKGKRFLFGAAFLLTGTVYGQSVSANTLERAAAVRQSNDYPSYDSLRSDLIREMQSMQVFSAADKELLFRVAQQFRDIALLREIETQYDRCNPHTKECDCNKHHCHK